MKAGEMLHREIVEVAGEDACSFAGYARRDRLCYFVADGYRLTEVRKKVQDR